MKPGSVKDEKSQIGEDAPSVGTPLAVHAARSSLWSLLGQGAQQVLGLLSFVLLSHWLSPSDYGLVGMAATVTGFLAVVGDAGMIGALVRLPQIDRATEATAFWVSLAGALLLALVSVSAAPALGWFYGDSRITLVALAMAMNFLLAAPGRVSTAKLSKGLAFKKLTWINFAATGTGLVLGCLVAAGGGGPWALVSQTAATFFAQTILAIVLAPFAISPRDFSSAHASYLARFGAQMSGFSLAIAASRAGDPILGGRFLGSSSVGFMSMGTRLMVTPMQRICGALASVFLPTVVLIEEKDQGRALATALRLTILLTVPMSLGVFALAPEIVCLLPKRWAALTATLQIYALGTLVEPIGWYSLAVMTAQGKARALLVMAIALIPLGWGGAALGARAGSVEWMVVAWAVWNAVGGAALLGMVWRPLGLRRWLWATLAIPFASGTVMVLIVRLALIAFGLSGRPAGLVIGLLVGAGAYGLALATVLRHDARRLVELLGAALRSRGVGAKGT